MTLYERITDDVKNALKNRDALKVSVLRMLLSAIKIIEIEKNVKTLDDGSVAQVLQRQIKQHRESIEQFKHGRRQDLVEKEEKELKILESYMPEQLSEAQILELIKGAIAESGAAAKSEVGKVMKIVMEKAKGKADGKVINQLAMQLLK